MPDNLSADVIKLEAADNSPVILPNGASAANAQFTRDGMDLYLTSPGGHTIKVDGYFAHDPAPDLVSADGGRLSPQMVEAFLPPQHPGETAANTGTTASDAGSVGKVTEVTGDATVTHSDGSHIKIEVGTTVHMGDVIQTSAKGAVHVLFADNTTFAISESARLSIDNYTYNPDDHSGTSFFSLLHGAFVYTSGLIGKSDPGNVNIETPVGSIGIRGTVVAGDINDAGQPSTITIVDGAIVVTNGGGTLQLSSAFDTATLTGYSTAPTDSGVMSTQSFNDAYSAVAPADPGFYSLTGTAPATTHDTTTAPVTTSPDTTTTAPDGMTQVSPDQTTAPATTTASTDVHTDTTVTTVTVTDPYDPTVTDASVALNDPTLATPPATTTFADTTTATTFGTISPSAGGTTGGTSFTGTTTSVTGTTATGSTSLTGTTVGTTSAATGGSTASTATVSNPPPLTAQFMFSDPYLNGTPGTTADDGIPLFGPLLASDLMKTTWGTSVTLGSVSVAPPPGITFVPTSYTLAGSHVVASGTGGWDIIGNKLAFDSTTSTTFGDTTVVTGVPIMHVDINGAGVVTLSFASTSVTDTLGVIPYIQQAGTFDFKITATDGTNIATTQSFGFQFQPDGSAPVLGPNSIILIGDEQGAGSIDNFFVGGNALLWGKGGDDIMMSTNGSAIMFGDAGNDTMTWSGGGSVKMYGGAGNDLLILRDPSFLHDGKSVIDGGGGTNYMQVGQASGPSVTYDFEGSKNVTGVDALVINGGAGTNNVVKLDFQDIFDMNAAHTLNIQNLNTGYGTSVIIDSAGQVTAPPTVSSATVGLDTVTTVTMVSNANTVTLIINQGANLANDGINVTVN